ncbi:MAG TPA: homoserine kinase [Actinomycetota bacterium]
MRVTVRVPATAANLGPGFDCFGLALELCNELVIDSGGPPGVAWEGEGADELPTDGSDLIGRVMSVVAGRMSLPLAPLSRRGRNRIPLERGLGSSSAAAIAGVVAASAMLDLGIDADPLSVFAMAAEIEGHPDNVAAAVFGGFTIALDDGTVQRLEPHPDLRPALIVPDLRMPTAAARAILPEMVPRSDAISNVARAAIEVEALTREPSLLSRALADRLHEDVRLASMPEVADVVAALRRDHVPVCVSGAGPSLVVFERPDRPPITLETLGVSASWRILRPGVRSRGFEVEIDGA